MEKNHQISLSIKLHYSINSFYEQLVYLKSYIDKGKDISFIFSSLYIIDDTFSYNYYQFSS